MTEKPLEPPPSAAGPPDRLSTGWKTPEPPRSSNRFVARLVLVGLGVALVWLSLPILGVLYMGDCTASNAVCEAAGSQMQTQAQLAFGIMIANSILAIVFAFVGGRWLALALLIAAVATLAMGWFTWEMGREIGPPPRGLFVTMPGEVLLALAAVVELAWPSRRQRTARV